MSQTETATRKTHTVCTEVPDENGKPFPSTVRLDEDDGHIITFSDKWRVEVDRNDLYPEQLNIRAYNEKGRRVFDSTVWARSD